MVKFLKKQNEKKTLTKAPKLQTAIL